MGVMGRLVAFAAALAVVFGVAWAAGQQLGSTPTGSAAGPPDQHSEAQDQHGEGQDEHGEPAGQDADAMPAGLSSASGGYQLEVDTPVLPAGSTDFRFRITGDGGAAVKAFAVEHDKLMHLILVRRDGTNYRHLHPELDPDGTWSVPVTLSAGGSYRAFADFRPEGGERTTLGIDLGVPGDFRPESPAPNDTFDVDGYRVRLEHVDGLVTATVTRGGQPVNDLQPYLGANGHLVALRSGDLAFLHVHPEASGLSFAAEFPTPGRYRLFLDFKHGDTVRTAEFTLDVPA